MVTKSKRWKSQDQTFETNEKLLDLETQNEVLTKKLNSYKESLAVLASWELEMDEVIKENKKLKETISTYEEKCKDMELDDMIEEREEVEAAHNLHDYVAATHRMNKYFENKLEILNKEIHNG